MDIFGGKIIRKCVPLEDGKSYSAFQIFAGALQNNI